jgi:cell division septal protein FtsQ
MKFLIKVKYLVPLLVILGLIFIVPRTLKIKNIICKNDSGDCSQRLIDEISGAKDLSLVNSQKFLGDLLAKDIYIKNFRIHFTLPANLLVTVSERKALIALQNKSDSQIAEVSNEGFVLNIVDATKLRKVIISFQLPPIGTQLDTKINFALNLVERLSDSYKIGSSQILENYLDVELDRGISVLFPLEGDSNLLLGSFVVIYGQLNNNPASSKIDISNIKYIDLRFDKPVLREKLES